MLVKKEKIGEMKIITFFTLLFIQTIPYQKIKRYFRWAKRTNGQRPQGLKSITGSEESECIHVGVYRSFALAQNDTTDAGYFLHYYTCWII